MINLAAAEATSAAAGGSQEAYSDDVGMTVLASKMKKWMFGLSEQEVTFDRRGFQCESITARAHLESAGKAFVAGYNAGLEHGVGPELEKKLASVAMPLTGFAFEGAAMALALLDWLTPWRMNRVSQFIEGAGDAHTYMIHVGAGWTLARLPRKIDTMLSKFDPLLRWLLIDGFGFHEGFFRMRNANSALPYPAKIKGYARNVFDQGLGRSFWFSEGANEKRIMGRISQFEANRHADLWSGVGLGSVYAGEVPAADLESLRHSSGMFLPQLAQGAAFAAKARQRANNMLPYQHLACGIICDMDPFRAAALTDELLENLPCDEATPAYAIWRSRIQQHFKNHLEVQT